MNTLKKKYFSINQMHSALIEIQKQIILSKWSPDIILSLNRGGCVPGVYLSHLINTPHEVIDISQREYKIKPDFYILEKAFIRYKSILIIDDINDTGRTLKYIEDTFEKYINRIKFSVLINNVSSKVKVDFVGEKINKKVDNSWIVFPWEEWKINIKFYIINIIK